MKPANYAPVYACIYPQLAELTRRHGYALDFSFMPCSPTRDQDHDEGTGQ